MTTTLDSVSSTAVTMAGALNTALADALAADRRVVVFGEDVGTLGGVFRVTDGLAERFGEDRVFDTPLAEAGIVGTAIGMAMNGLRPVVEMQFDAFAYPAFEQVTSHLAKLHNRTRGTVSLPIVVRIPYGGGIGGVEHHCDSSEVYYTHTPGLRVVTPASPADAYRLLRQSIDCPDPVIFLEPKRRYWSREAAELTSAGPAIDQATVVRPGTGVTLISYGGTVATALLGRRTGRAVVIHEAAGFCGYGAEIAARLTERCFHYLQAPILRVTGFDTPYPPPMLEGHHLPSTDRILDAIARLQWDDEPDQRWLSPDGARA